ncbi:hypothetical protein D3C85_1939610 [compost metagenome]
MSDRIIVLAPNPGRIRKTFLMPEAVRAAVPFEARELPQFHTLFRQIWQEFGGVQHG